MDKKDNTMSSSTGAIKKRREDKHRKRDPRSWENVKKFTSSLSEEDRMNYIGMKYSELYDEHRTSTTSMNSLQKAFGDVLKEKDREQADLTKAILAKGHLESLCRELQKQNKAIRDENLTRIKEEEERRREIANNFNESLNALTTLMTESKDKSNRVKEENESMSDRLTDLCAQFQARENHLEALTRQMELQKKLYETTIQKTDLTHKAEKETWTREKTTLETDLQKSEVKVKALMEKVATLEAHVDIYKKQYSEFESTMAKSNKVFSGFKEEMAKVTKQSALMEKDRDEWKNRWQSSASSLINISEQHNLLTSEYQKSEKRIRALQKLCRRIQAERTAYMQQLKEHQIELETPVIIDDDEQAYGDAPVLPKTAEPLAELRKDLQKIKEEKLGAAQSAVEHDKLTAKEELLKVLRGELADLQKEVGLPNREGIVKKKNLKRSSKKKLKECEDETRQFTTTEFLPSIPQVHQVYPVATYTDKINDTSSTSDSMEERPKPPPREEFTDEAAGPSSLPPGPSSRSAEPSSSGQGPSSRGQRSISPGNGPSSRGQGPSSRGQRSISPDAGPSSPGQRSISPDAAPSSPEQRPGSPSAGPSFLGSGPSSRGQDQASSNAGPSFLGSGPSSLGSGAPVVRVHAMQNGPLDESASTTTTTSDTDEGIDMRHAHLNGTLDVEVYSISSEEHHVGVAPIPFQPPPGIGMGDGQRIPDPFDDSLSTYSNSSDESLRVSALREALPEVNSSSSSTLVSIHVQTDHSHGDDIPTLEIAVEDMTYLREHVSATSLGDESLSFVALDNAEAGSMSNRIDAQIQTLYSVPVSNITGNPALVVVQEMPPKRATVNGGEASSSSVVDALVTDDSISEASAVAFVEVLETVRLVCGGENPPLENPPDQVLETDDLATSEDVDALCGDTDKTEE